MLFPNQNVPFGGGGRAHSTQVRGRGGNATGNSNYMRQEQHRLPPVIYATSGAQFGFQWGTLGAMCGKYNPHAGPMRNQQRQTENFMPNANYMPISSTGNGPQALDQSRVPVSSAGFGGPKQPNATTGEQKQDHTAVKYPRFGVKAQMNAKAIEESKQMEAVGPTKKNETNEPMELTVASGNTEEYRKRLNEATKFGLNGCFSFHVQGKTVKVLELAFAVVSPAFMRLMKSDSEEAKTHKINVDNLSVEAVEQFANYVHCEKSEGLKSIATATDVSILADKFEITELKEICLRYITTHALTTKNIVKRLEYAFKSQDGGLKQEAIDFIVGPSGGITISEFLRLDDWCALEKSDSSLAFKIMGVILVGMEKRVGECKAKLDKVVTMITKE